MPKKHRIALVSVIAAIAAGAAVFTFANAETIENLQKQISAAQQELSTLIPLLDNSGGTPEENTAIKNEINSINGQADALGNQWKNISAPQSQVQVGWQDKTIQTLQQTIESIKSTFGIM
jgi:hypothetical protein